MVPFPLSLTPIQCRALEVLGWLHDEGSRQTGRSTVLALHYLRLLVSHPGEWFEVEDHHHHLVPTDPSPWVMDRNLVGVIRSMAQDIGLRGLEVSSNGLRVCLPLGQGFSWESLQARMLQPSLGPIDQEVSPMTLWEHLDVEPDST